MARVVHKKKMQDRMQFHNSILFLFCFTILLYFSAPNLIPKHWLILVAVHVNLTQVISLR